VTLTAAIAANRPLAAYRDRHAGPDADCAAARTAAAANALREDAIRFIGAGVQRAIRDVDDVGIAAAAAAAANRHQTGGTAAVAAAAADALGKNGMRLDAVGADRAAIDDIDLAAITVALPLPPMLTRPETPPPSPPPPPTLCAKMP
jgi:hypothetical protein